MFYFKKLFIVCLFVCVCFHISIYQSYTCKLFLFSSPKSRGQFMKSVCCEGNLSNTWTESHLYQKSLCVVKCRHKGVATSISVSMTRKTLLRVEMKSPFLMCPGSRRTGLIVFLPVFHLLNQDDEASSSSDPWREEHLGETSSVTISTMRERCNPEQKHLSLS
jgi:hypothetical protein